ncbi:MAG: response regulator transcription factor [Bacteroidota bacterium]
MIKVTIVEDILEIREVLKKNISRLHLFECVSSYQNGESAIRGVISLKNKPDVIIMDIGLPDIKGTECMEKIKMLYPNIKFLMYTIFENDENVFESLKKGADGYILKKDPFNKISEAIQEIVKGGAPMSREIAKKVLFSFRKTPPAKSTLEKLTKREFEVAELLSQGLPYQALAKKLNISVGTVKQHIHKIYKKLQVNNRIEASLLFQKS